MGITAYWPQVTIFILLFAISAYGLWGLWYLLSRREVLIRRQVAG